MGANAFAHESGIHQDGMLKSKATYEIITPEEIGLVRLDDAGIVLGELLLWLWVGLGHGRPVHAGSDVPRLPLHCVLWNESRHLVVAWQYC